MDRPRSPVQDAGRWVRSIQPLGCLPVDKHEERGRLPAVGRDSPARGCLFDCQRRLTQPPGFSPRPAWEGGPWDLSPVHRLLQPARGRRELRMFVVTVFHLLDVVVVVSVVADVPPVADVVAAGEVGGASHWPATLSDPPRVPPSTSQRHSPVPPGDGRTTPTVRPCHGKPGMANWRRTHHAQGQTPQW